MAIKESFSTGDEILALTQENFLDLVWYLIDQELIGINFVREGNNFWVCAPGVPVSEIKEKCRAYTASAIVDAGQMVFDNFEQSQGRVILEGANIESVFILQALLGKLAQSVSLKRE